MNALYLNRLTELKTKISNFKTKHKAVKIIFKTPNYFPGDFTENRNCISAWNAKRMDRIGQVLFENDENVDLVSLFDRTEVIYDMFGRTAAAIHPGMGGGQNWVLNDIERENCVLKQTIEFTNH